MRVVFLGGLGSVKKLWGLFFQEDQVQKLGQSRCTKQDFLSTARAISSVSICNLVTDFIFILFLPFHNITFQHLGFHFIIALRTRFVCRERNRFVFVCVLLYIRNIFSIEAIYPSLVSWEIICTTVRRRGHTQNMLQSTINDTKVINKY